MDDLNSKEPVRPAIPVDIREDGCWLRFDAGGYKPTICLQALAASYQPGDPTGEAIREWCEAAIRAAR
jgi:hypothetical protein